MITTGNSLFPFFLTRLKHPQETNSLPTKQLCSPQEYPKLDSKLLFYEIFFETSILLDSFTQRPHYKYFQFYSTSCPMKKMLEHRFLWQYEEKTEDKFGVFRTQRKESATGWVLTVIAKQAGIWQLWRRSWVHQIGARCQVLITSENEKLPCSQNLGGKKASTRSYVGLKERSEIGQCGDSSL